MSEKLTTGRGNKKTNYYMILDLMPGATHNDILHAYNRAKSTYSKGSLASYTLLEDDANDTILEEIEEAYTILGNPSKRRAYDIEMGFETWTEKNSSSSRKLTTDGPMQSTAAVGRSPKNSRMLSLPPDEEDRQVKESKADDSTERRVIPLNQGSGHEGHFDPNPDFEAQIQNCSEVSGDFLKTVRIYRAMTAETVASKCKLSSSHIYGIENEDPELLHKPVYLRGHICLICECLGIPNGRELAVSFVRRMISEGKIDSNSY